MAALTLSDLQTLRDKLTRARLGGVREVRDQNGEAITYKSDREMQAALASVESQIAALQSGKQSNVIRFQTSKGLES